MIDFEQLIKRHLHVTNDTDSHTERNPHVFHPSQLARCKRQAAISKFGLDDHDTDTLGTFYVGTMIHEWLEGEFADRLEGVEFEKPLEKDYDAGITVTGHCDVYDSYDEAVYDFKTRSSWYNFNPPVDRHLDQLALYIDMVGADHGQIVYICKKNLEVRTWPEKDLWTPSQTRVSGLIKKAVEMKDAVDENGIPGTVANVPFDPCGCWLCDREQEVADG